MNQHLQNILTILQQDKNLSAEEKKAILASLKDADKELEITLFKLDKTEKVKRTTAILLEETIEELEQKRKAVEAQNRELEIESSLERVRTVAMSMNKPDDMLDVCRIISEQLALLKVKDIRNVQTAIFYESSGSYTNYEFYAKHDKTIITQVDYGTHAVQRAFADQMMKGPNEMYTTGFEGKQVREWYEYQKTTNVFIDSYLETASSLTYYWYSLGPVALGISTYVPLKEEEINLFIRFRNVFELAYRRFIDIELAMAQAKEAQIEASLERVRAQALSMYKPDDLPGICEVLFTELNNLGFSELRNAMVNIFDDDKGSFINYDYSANAGKTITNLSYNTHPVIEKQVQQARTSADAFSEAVFQGEDLKKWKTFREKAGEKEDLKVNNIDSLFYYFYSIETGVIGISTYHSITEEKRNLLKRFRNVFDFAYRRYMDVAQAEIQAREAQIELALERVRARTMAMQHSEELQEAAKLLFQQVKALGLPVLTCGYNIWEKDEKVCTAWMSSEDGFILPPFRIPLTESPFTIRFYESRQKEESFYAEEVAGEALAANYRYLLTLPGFAEIIDGFLKSGFTLPDFQVNHVANFSHGNIIFVTYEPVPESWDIFKRFTAVFDQTYTRFLDLKKAEAQAREAKIETALERTRTQSMIMQHSNELDDTLRVFHEQVLLLGIRSAFSFLWLPDEEKAQHIFWAAWAEGKNNSTFKSKAITYPLDRNEPATAQCLVDWKSNEPVYSYAVPAEGVANYFAAWKELIDGVEKLTPEHFAGGLYYVEAFMKYGCFGVILEKDLTGDEKKILARFAIEFERAYTRFLDLQKSEAQAREAQIQLALERVRARTMAMQKSDELAETVFILFQQFKQLGENPDQATIGIINEEEWVIEYWVTMYGNQTNGVYKFPIDEPNVTNRIYKAWKEQKKSLVIELSGKELYDFAHFRESMGGAVYNENEKKRVINVAFFSKGIVNVQSNESRSADSILLLERFAAVFEQTYTRFLDLQKAEEQSKESQVQLAMERVRARTMAMQQSDELPDAANVLFQQVQSLGMPAWSAGYCIWDDDKKAITLWMSSAGIIQQPFKAPVTEDPSFIHFFDAYKRGETFYVEAVGGNELVTHYKYMLTLPVVGDMLNQFIKDGGSLPVFQIFHLVFFSQGFLLFIAYEQVPEAHDIFKRFGKVFEQTYTRFLDLQKAEFNARESKIEAAMEKVRARAMAMQKPNELVEVAQLLRREMNMLGVEELETSSIYIHHEDTKQTECWYAIKDIEDPGKGLVSDHMTIGLTETWVGKEMLAFYRSGQKKISITMRGDNRKEWINYCAAHSKVLEGFYGDTIPDRVYHLYKFSSGYIGAASPGEISAESWDLLQRATSVFSLAYTRFSDLQQAETQAREAQIEVALERVRSRTLAMQKSDELAETAAVLFRQLINLGIAPNRLYIGIVKNDKRQIEYWVTDEDGSKINTQFTGDAGRNASMKKMYDAWKEQKKSLTIDMQGKELENYFHYLADELKVPFKQGLEQKRRIQSIAFFGKGFIGIASPNDQPEETILLLERFAAVFNLTYTRFNDLKLAEAHAIQAKEDLIKLQTEKKRAEDALSELRATQTQLIQSEKMASLGELTAGIAHEIQNPLNFVNNFSEVSRELIEELKNQKLKPEEQEDLLNDIDSNLEKINHHGKRADAIVKGMLQHSRSSSAAKEPTDINKLADEYLRLAYHGLRAKDKSFNAALKTDYDESVGHVPVVSQDIGRAILNLITNAFYAVNEKKKELGDHYEPAVSVITKKVNNKVEIIVADNGNGIPQNIIDKIFQPFFTTKPTGSGTGLGLSLSYDIVKAHGGELSVKTTAGQGSEFILALPA